jgi:hypothetical protein
MSYQQDAFIRTDPRYLEDSAVSEKEKNGGRYLKSMIDYHIYRLVEEKKRMKVARNYYEGKRDAKEFAYLENNYGIGNPGKLGFTPLVKPRIDVLVGMMLQEQVKFMVRYNDNATISGIEQEKMEGFLNDLFNFIAKENQGGGQTRPITEKQIDAIKKSYGESYKSMYEKAATDLIQFFLSNRKTDFIQKTKQLLLDLLITGEGFYRTFIPKLNADPILEICKPENVFFNKNTNHQYLGNSDAVVHREFMTRIEILNKYGVYMSADDKEALFNGTAKVKGNRRIVSPKELDVRNDDDYNSVIDDQFTYNNHEILEVYHVEWLANNKVEVEDPDEFTLVDGVMGKPKKYVWRLDRYEGIRIGLDIYLNAGKSRHISRDDSDPYRCDLTYNGISYNDRNGSPYSMSLKMKDLQDLYDITIFHRDNLIANSGSTGSRINVAGIPKELGDDFMVRVMKFIAFKKQGVELINPLQENADKFSGYGDYDNTVKGQTIQGIQSVLESIENQANTITGVTKQMLAQIEEREAVSNVKTGIVQASLVTKDMMDLHKTVRVHMLSDLLDWAKHSFVKGKKGSYILGQNIVAFHAAPEYFRHSNFDIHIVADGREASKLAKLEQLAVGLAGQAPPDAIVKVLLADSVAEAKEAMSVAMDQAKQEEQGGLEEQLAQMQQQLQEAQNELKQLAALKENNAEANAAKLRADAEKSKEAVTDMKERRDMDRKEAENKRDLDKALFQLEREELYAGGSANKEVNNNIAGR